MAGIPKFTANPPFGDIRPSPAIAETPTPLQSSQSSSEKRTDLDNASVRQQVKYPPGSSMQAALTQASASLEEKLLMLAKQPKLIANKLVKDPEFLRAYVAFIDQLTKLSNGSIEVHDPEALRRANELAFANYDQHQEAWEKTRYSSALAQLPKVQNPLLTASAKSMNDSVEDLILAMRETPEKSIFWMINGNNHFHTHEGLKPVLRKIAEARPKRQEDSDKDVVLISGNAAGITPFGDGPVVKYTDPEGKHVGPPDSSEAEAIESLLKTDPTVEAHFLFDQEKRAKNTRENILNTNKKLKDQNKELKNFIAVNSQSGFSGLRSALTQLGLTNNENLPTKIYLINPDIKPKESASTLSYEATGKMFIQAMREFMNLTADISRSFFIPPIPIPQEIIDNFTVCLQKIGIEPHSMNSHEVQNLLRQMHETAMLPSEEKLVDPQKGYASEVKSYKEDSKNLRVKQDALEILRDRWDNETNAAHWRRLIQERRR